MWLVWTSYLSYPRQMARIASCGQLILLQSDLTLLTPTPPFPLLDPLGYMSSMYGSITAYSEKFCQIEARSLWQNLLESCIVFSESSWQPLQLIIHKEMGKQSKSIKN